MWDEIKNAIVKKTNKVMPVIKPNRHARRAHAATLTRVYGKTKKGATHKVNPPGTKMTRKASMGTLAINNPGGVVSDFFKYLQKEKWAEKHPD